MNKFLFSGIILFVNFLCGGCTLYHHYPQIEGAVFDSHSGKPVKNAAVVGIYNMKKNTSYGEALEHIHVMETKTNAEGRFFFKDKSIFSPTMAYDGFSEAPLFYIFAPGYEMFTGNSPQSHFDFMKTDLGNGSYRVNARQILSLVRKGKTKVYQFRLSPLKTAKKRFQNLCYTELDVDPSLIPYYQTQVKNENLVYGRYGSR